MSNLGTRAQLRSRRRTSPQGGAAGDLGESDVWGSELSPDCVGADLYGDPDPYADPYDYQVKPKRRDGRDGRKEGGRGELERGLSLLREASPERERTVPTEIRLCRVGLQGCSVKSDLHDSSDVLASLDFGDDDYATNSALGNPLDVSDYTRRSLAGMGASQLEDARRAMEAAEDRRRLSGSLMRRQNELLMAAKHAEDVMRRMDALEGGMEEIDLSGGGAVDWPEDASAEEEDGRPQEDPPKASREEAASGGRRGLGRLWGRITSNLQNEAPPKSKDAPPRAADDRAAPSREVSGDSYYRRGARKKRRCHFLQAIQLFNFALIRQRDELGENDVACAATLNEIGVCWMMLGERSQAMAALEEALYIRQKHLGHGAEEVAETTNNIWMLMHKQGEEGRQEPHPKDEESDDEDAGASICVGVEDFRDYSEEKDDRNESIEDFWARITTAPS